MSSKYNRRASFAEAFAKRVHAETGCFYDEVAFDKHLDHVHSVFSRYSHLVEEQIIAVSEGAATIEVDFFGTPSTMTSLFVFESEELDSLLEDVECAIWLHDVIEDCRVSYADLERDFGTHVAELVYALTNELAKNRSEMADRTYPKLRAAGGLAVFVKLCDRIANTEAACSVATECYLSMYRKEYAKFRDFLYREGEWEEMWSHLDQITGANSAKASENA